MDMTTATTTVYTAVFVQDETDGGYTAWIEEIPGATSEGVTLEETRANLRAALTLLLEENRAFSEEQSAGRHVIREPLAM
jgi:predicted RNase H-like HicB family nuclease